MMLILLIVTLGVLGTLSLYKIFTDIFIRSKRLQLKNRMVLACACNGRDIDRVIKEDRSSMLAKSRLLISITNDRKAERKARRVIYVNYIALAGIEERKQHIRFKALGRNIYSKACKILKLIIKLMYIKGDEYRDYSKGR